MMNLMSADFADVARRLAEVGRRFDARGWVLGTSGNFSAVVGRDPLRLAITRQRRCQGRADAPTRSSRSTTSGTSSTARGRAVGRDAAASRDRRARAAPARCCTPIRSGARSCPTARAATAGSPSTGYEMLKGLDGVTTHEHREWIPILDNDQDMARLARDVRRAAGEQPACHAFLLRRHGLYTWGATLPRGGPARRDPRVPARRRVRTRIDAARHGDAIRGGLHHGDREDPGRERDASRRRRA